ncbi:MAG: response regulator [Bacteroidia bacterium]|nr:response regulator [Bacteroidia bacterium]
MEKKIFIVDDDPFWTALLSGLLSKMGFKNIITFSNGKECLDNLNQEPNFLFVDFNLDGLTGYELLGEIKKLRPQSNIIVCTATNSININQLPQSDGSIELLLKSNLDIKSLKGLMN